MLAVITVAGLGLLSGAEPAGRPASGGPPGAITVRTPTPYAVFQRSADNRARIPIAGTIAATVTRTIARIEARAALMAPYQPGVDGVSGAFTAIAGPQTGAFAGSLEVPAGGWYALTVRALDAAGQVLAEGTVAKIGVGEVFVAAGHSFCSNYNADAPSTAQDDRVATCADWTQAPSVPLAFRHADDPLRTGDERRASPWPAVGDRLVAQLHVPVLWICTGMGGSTVAQWRAGAEDAAVTTRGYPAFRTTLQALTPYSGLRAVVWLGNENDLWSGPTAEAFSADLRAVILHARSDSGDPTLPWVIAFDAYDPGVAPKVGAAEKQRRKERLDRGTQLILESVPYTYDGPQTDDLGPEFRRSDGDHFNTAGLDQLGIRFARSIMRAFFPAAAPAPLSPRLATP